MQGGISGIKKAPRVRRGKHTHHLGELYMHYYKFNIADWVKDTSHLSLKEEAILLRLVNWYLDYESPIPTKTQMVLRKIGISFILFIMRDEKSYSPLQQNQMQHIML